MSVHRLCVTGALSCVFALIADQSVDAASWISIIGGPGQNDRADDMELTSDGGCVIAGESNGLGWLAKISPNGKVIWQKSYGGVEYGYFRAMDQRPDGGFILAGDCSRTRRRSLDFWCVKTGPTGKVLWQRSYGGDADDEVEDVKTAADGGFFLVGSTRSFGAGNSDAWCVRIDASGNIVWQKALGGSEHDYAYSVLPDGDGGCVVAGRLDRTLWLFKLDLSGSLVWSKTYGWTTSYYRAAIARAADGGTLAASASPLTASPGRACLWVLRLDAVGSVMWQKRCTDPSPSWPSDSVRSVCVLADGGILAGGMTYGGYGYSNMGFFRRFDSSGSMIWQKSLFSHTSGTNAHSATAVGGTAGGDVLVSGYTTARGLHGDAFVIRVPGDGNYAGDCNRLYDTSYTVTDLAAPVANATPAEAVTSVVGLARRIRARAAGLAQYQMCD